MSVARFKLVDEEAASTLFDADVDPTPDEPDSDLENAVRSRDLAVEIAFRGFWLRVGLNLFVLFVAFCWLRCLWFGGMCIDLSCALCCIVHWFRMMARTTS